ncbi:MAG TPA: hypothetical protein VMI32_04745 [Candidatus Solibacter sp.]|nr:hypothetical protein [Candidatus Solibacter sp.]
MRLNAPLILLSCLIFLSSLASAKTQSDSADQFIGSRLTSLSASNGGNPTDCGSTTLNRPDAKTTACAQAAFQDRKPFHILYYSAFGFFKSAYGLAGDANGNVYEVEYDSRGLLNLALGKRSQVYDGNRVRVTTCMKPVRLGSTQEGLLACITPVNEEESKLAAQQKPIETTVCAILEHPSAFNNKMVRIRGYASGNFEYSELGADGCTASLWFAYGNGGGPPDLVATVSGGARPGSEDAEGRLILPVPVKLVQDANFQRFQKLMMARAKADERSMKNKDADSWTFYRVAATFTGRIDAVSDDIHAFHLKRKDTDRADFLGFGQMGLFDAQFVLQSVGNDAVLEKFPPMPNPERSNPPKP